MCLARPPYNIPPYHPAWELEDNNFHHVTLREHTQVFRKGDQLLYHILICQFC